MISHLCVVGSGNGLNCEDAKNAAVTVWNRYELKIESCSATSLEFWLAHNNDKVMSPLCNTVKHVLLSVL